jgi:hypothetical protein
MALNSLRRSECGSADDLAIWRRPDQDVPNVGDSTPKLQPAYFPIPALCGHTGKQKLVKLMATDATKVMKFGPQARYYELAGDRTDSTTGSPVQQVLLNPHAIFEGVRDHQSGGLCYCGSPTCAYTNDGAKIPPVPDKVFCVYLSPLERLFEWGWEISDPDYPGLPLGWKTRYKVQLWPKILPTS